MSIALVGIAFAQVPVSFAPPIHFQFFTSSGLPLSNGKLYTYVCGTTTLLNTYVDASGTTQNADPIPLDQTGSPSNSSGGQTGIFLANLCYKFVAYDQFSTFQWSIDNVTTYFGLLNTANTWSLAQTFSGQIIDTLTDNQIVLGSGGNQTTLDAPPPSGNVTLHFPSTTDTLVGRATTDTLTNKTLTSPTISGGTATNLSLVMPSINSTLVTNDPATYFSIANASPGTNTNSLVKLTNAPAQATIAAISDISGEVGICVSSCGSTGTAIVQSSGTVNCIFDGAVNAGDYVIISTTIAGDCHDSGSSYPSLTQILGRVLVTNAVNGTYSMLLYGADVKIPTASSGGTPVLIANAGVTGTTTNTLTKLTGAPSTAVIAATTDQGGVIGITIGGAGTTGTATIQVNGIAPCLFDGATTAGDYVMPSTSTAGDCHDAGSTLNLAGLIVGRVLSTNGAAGTFNIELFNQEVRAAQYTTANGCLASGTTCTVTTSWPNTWANTNYHTLCTPTGQNSSGAVFWISSQTTTQFVISISNLGFSNNGGYTGFYCEGRYN